MALDPSKIGNFKGVNKNIHLIEAGLKKGAHQISDALKILEFFQKVKEALTTIGKKVDKEI